MIVVDSTISRMVFAPVETIGDAADTWEEILRNESCNFTGLSRLFRAKSLSFHGNTVVKILKAS